MCVQKDGELYMSDFSEQTIDIPPEQQAIRNRCFHPSGNFIEFRKEEIEQSIPERFEEQVRKHPDRLAVKTPEKELSYFELNKAANQVAHAILAQRGQGPEPVPLLLNQGIPLAIGIIGVLKAGKICMPLDPSYPKALMSSLVQESRAEIILTDNANRAPASHMALDAALAVDGRAIHI